MIACEPALCEQGRGNQRGARSILILGTSSNINSNRKRRANLNNRRQQQEEEGDRETLPGMSHKLRHHKKLNNKCSRFKRRRLLFKPTKDVAAKHFAANTLTSNVPDLKRHPCVSRQLQTPQHEVNSDGLRGVRRRSRETSASWWTCLYCCPNSSLVNLIAIEVFPTVPSPKRMI